MKPVIAIVLAVAALAGCRMEHAYPQSIKDSPRISHPGDREYVWRKERRVPWVAGGNPYAREYFDQQDARNGGSHNE